MGTRYNTKVEYDHKGNRYESLAEMCKAYKINCDTYLVRIRRGMSKEAALTTPVRHKDRQQMPYTDHKGNVFKSTKDMCDAYRIPTRVFYKRYKILGWSLEKSLTTPVRYRRA